MNEKRRLDNIEDLFVPGKVIVTQRENTSLKNLIRRISNAGYKIPIVDGDELTVTFDPDKSNYLDVYNSLRKIGSVQDVARVSSYDKKNNNKFRIPGLLKKAAAYLALSTMGASGTALADYAKKKEEQQLRNPAKIVDTRPVERNIDYPLANTSQPKEHDDESSAFNIKDIISSFSLAPDYNNKFSLAAKGNLETKLNEKSSAKAHNSSSSLDPKEVYARIKGDIQDSIKKDAEKKGISAGTVALIAAGVAAVGTVAYLLLHKTPEEKVKIQALTNVIDTFSKNNVPGARVSYIYNGQTISGTPGQLTNIADVVKGTASINVQIVAEADNYAWRKILQATMTPGSNTYTINIAPRTASVEGYTFNYNKFVSSGYPTQIVKNNIIPRIKVPANGIINVYFNPGIDDPTMRFNSSQIQEIKNFWSWVKAHNGEITDVKFNENANIPYPTVPKEGEWYYYANKGGSTASNTTFTNADGSVKSNILKFNAERTKDMTWPFWTEGFDSLFDGEQNMTEDEWMALVIFASKRIAGNNNEYSITIDGEQQKLPDNYSGANAAANNSAKATRLNASGSGSVSLNQKIGDNVDVGVGINGKRVDLSLGYRDEDGNVNLQKQGKDVYLNGNRRFGKKNISSVDAGYDTISKALRVNADLNPIKDLRFRVGIDNLLNLERASLGSSYKIGDFGLSGDFNLSKSTDRGLDLDSASGQVNFRSEDIDVAAMYIYNKFGFGSKSSAGLRMNYRIDKNLQVNLDFSKSADWNDIRLGLAKAFEIFGNKGNISVLGGLNRYKKPYITISVAGVL